MSETTNSQLVINNNVNGKIEQRLSHEVEVLSPEVVTLIKQINSLPLNDASELTDQEKLEFIKSMKLFYDQLSKAATEISKLRASLKIDENSDPKEIERWEKAQRAILLKTFKLKTQELSFFDDFVQKKLFNKKSEDIPLRPLTEFDLMPKNVQLKMDELAATDSLFNLVLQTIMTTPAVTAGIAISLPLPALTASGFLSLGILGLPATILIYELAVNKSYLAVNNIIQTKAEQGKKINKETVSRYSLRGLAMAFSTLLSSVGVAIGVGMISPALPEFALEKQLNTYSQDKVEQILTKDGQRLEARLANLNQRSKSASDALIASNPKYAGIVKQIQELEEDRQRTIDTIQKLEEDSRTLRSQGKTTEAVDTDRKITILQGRLTPNNQSDVNLQRSSYQYRLAVLEAEKKKIEDSSPEVTKARGQVEKERTSIIQEQQRIQKELEIAAQFTNPYDLLEQAGVLNKSNTPQATVQKINNILNDAELARQILKLGVEDYQKLVKVKENWSKISQSEKLDYSIESNLKNPTLFILITVLGAILECLICKRNFDTNHEPDVLQAKQRENLSLTRKLLDTADKIVGTLANQEKDEATQKQKQKIAAARNILRGKFSPDDVIDEVKSTSQESSDELTRLVGTPLFANLLTTLAAHRAGPFAVLGAVNDRQLSEKSRKNDREQAELSENTEKNKKIINQNIITPLANLTGDTKTILETLQNSIAVPVTQEGKKIYNRDLLIDLANLKNRFSGISKLKYPAENQEQDKILLADLANIYTRYSDTLNKELSLNEKDEIKNALIKAIKKAISKYQSGGNSQTELQVPEILDEIRERVAKPDQDNVKIADEAYNIIISTGRKFWIAGAIKTKQGKLQEALDKLNKIPQFRSTPESVQSEIVAFRDSINYLLAMQQVGDVDVYKDTFDKCLIEMAKRYQDKNSDPILNYAPYQGYLNQLKAQENIVNAQNNAEINKVQDKAQRLHRLNQLMDEVNLKLNEGDPLNLDKDLLSKKAKIQVAINNLKN